MTRPRKALSKRFRTIVPPTVALRSLAPMRATDLGANSASRLRIVMSAFLPFLRDNRQRNPLRMICRLWKGADGQSTGLW
jgi:hypothetical protein